MLKWLEELFGIKPAVKDLSSDDIDWLEKRPATGKLGGKIMKANQIRKLKGFLSERGVKLVEESQSMFKRKYRDIFYEMYLSKTKVGAFDRATKELYLTKKATEIVAFHEQAHVQQWYEIGEEAYNALTKLERETYVWEQILKNRQQWTEAELRDALDYINGFREKAGLIPIKL